MRVTLAGRPRGGTSTRALLGLALLVAGCGASAAGSRTPATRRVGNGRPSLSVIDRDGDPAAAVAVAVTTTGIAPERGSTVAVSLAALVDARLAARAADGSLRTNAHATVVGGSDGWRLRAFATTPAEGAALVDAVRAAMVNPVTNDDVALAAVGRKVDALARRAVADRALLEVTQCTGEAYGGGEDATPSATELETWRRAAHGLGRVAIATTGPAWLADAVADALLRAPPWPSAALVTPSPWLASEALATVYDASGDVAPGAARITVTAHTGAPARAVAAAQILGDPRGPLASRLAALDGRPRMTSVVAAVHRDGGCLAATLDLGVRDLLSDGPARIATAAALVLQEVAGEAANVSAPPELGHLLAMRATDPREAAEIAAWWSLAPSRAPTEGDLRVVLTVGIAPGGAATAAGPSGEGAASAALRTVRAEIDRATIALHARAVEARTRVERGQGETWVLLASTCGAFPEASQDAGAGAAVALSAAAQAELEAGDARVEPFVAPDGIGVLAHGPARPGESPAAQARRVSDAAARAFIADTLDDDRITRARTALLVSSGSAEARSLAVLGGVLAPGHPSWLEPIGTAFSMASVSNAAIASRAEAMREGPLRVAVLANADASQAETAVRSVDRWIARPPGGAARACAPTPMVGPVLAGTYAVELPAGALSSALLALPLSDDAATRAAATWVAAALGGADGLLARVLGVPNAAAPGKALARGWSCSVLGGPRSQALVVRVLAAEASLDAAVAQTRALLDRLRQGGMREEDRARAALSLARAAVEASLDPRIRAIELWRGEAAGPPPSLDALRAFASASLRDEALVIVAARPPKADPVERASVRDPAGKGRP